MATMRRAGCAPRPWRAGGTAVTYALDAQGRATGIGENAGGSGPYTSTFGYNANDLPTRVVLPTANGGVTQTAGYDGNSRVTHVDASGPTTGLTTTRWAGPPAWWPR